MNVRVSMLALVGAASLFATACGGGSEAETSGPSFIEQGSQNLGADDVVTTTTAAAAAGGASEGNPPDDGGDEGDGQSGDGTDTTTTLPQNEQSQSENIDDLFTAMRTFNSCLADAGTEFIGAPSEGLPADDPRMAESYIESLSSCAAVSRIQEAFAAADLGSEGKSPEEIEELNRGLVLFRDCLKGRGWNPAELQPDENGLLQIGDMGAPEGENIFESDDMDECRRSAQDQAEAEAEGDG